MYQYLNSEMKEVGRLSAAGPAIRGTEREVSKNHALLFPEFKKWKFRSEGTVPLHYALLEYEPERGGMPKEGQV
jgi:hypothetical protein